MTLEFNINGRRNTDYAFVHITSHGAKVTLHFPKLKIGESMERYDSYAEAERRAMEINASKLDIDEKDIFLVTLDTSTYPIDDKKTIGVITGCFEIKNIKGEVIERVLYEPEDRMVCAGKTLGLTDVAEISTAIYMFKYLNENGYDNVIVNYDNVKICSCLKGNVDIYSQSEKQLVFKLRGAVNKIKGKIVFQHLKSHTGHKNLDVIDEIARRSNREYISTMKKGLILN